MIIFAYNLNIIIKTKENSNLRKNLVERVSVEKLNWIKNILILLNLKN